MLICAIISVVHSLNCCAYSNDGEKWCILFFRTQYFYNFFSKTTRNFVYIPGITIRKFETIFQERVCARKKIKCTIILSRLFVCFVSSVIIIHHIVWIWSAPSLSLFLILIFLLLIDINTFELCATLMWLVTIVSNRLHLFSFIPVFVLCIHLFPPNSIIIIYFYSVFFFLLLVAIH